MNIHVNLWSPSHHWNMWNLLLLKSVICVENHQSRPKVHDHCHLTGQYRGLTCQPGNTAACLSRRRVPILLHNWKGYDAHDIVKGGSAEMKIGSLLPVPPPPRVMTVSTPLEVWRRIDGRLYISIPSNFYMHPLHPWLSDRLHVRLWA
jgi:hypothetical protein